MSIHLPARLQDYDRRCCTCTVADGRQAAGKPYWLFIEHDADHIVAMRELTEHQQETDLFIEQFVLGKKADVVRTDWFNAKPLDMSSPARMAEIVPYYIYGFGMYLEEMAELPQTTPDEIVY